MFLMRKSRLLEVSDLFDKQILYRGKCKKVKKKKDMFEIVLVASSVSDNCSLIN